MKSLLTDAPPGPRPLPSGEISEARFGIIGGGPKGTYALERLLSVLAQIPAPDLVTVDVFETSGHFGAGHVYAPDLPDYLLMNFSASNIDMWPTRPAERSSSIAPSTPSLLSWLEQRGYHYHSTDPFVPRRVVGEYLTEGFRSLLQNLPDRVRVQLHADQVVDIDEEQTQFTVETKHSRRSLSPYDSLILCTGHQFRNPETEANEIPSVYPPSVLDKVSSEDAVAIRGMGLTFVDCVLILTEGRGGKFHVDESGACRYQASGNEPSVILPYSRSGEMMVPRGPGRAGDLPPLTHFVRSNLPTEIDGRGLCFRSQLLPLLKADFEEQCGVFPGDLDRHSDPVETLRSELQALHQTDPGQRLSTIWPRALPLFRELYQFGSLRGESQEDFDRSLLPQLARWSFGPPVENARKVLALADAGLIDFRFARNPKLIRKPDSVSLVNRSGESVRCATHINATIPRDAGTTCLTPLMRLLAERGHARPFVNDHYRPGCLEINARGSLLSAQGKPQPIYLYGTPTEGIVHDNDTLSRNANDFATTWAEDCRRLVEKNART